MIALEFLAAFAILVGIVCGVIWFFHELTKREGEGK